MDKVKVGDKIRAMRLLVTIGEIFYQYYDEDTKCWDIEFLDASGGYRHWKQYFDGGELIRT